jgi:hypothetical protein
MLSTSFQFGYVFIFIFSAGLFSLTLDVQSNDLRRQLLKKILPKLQRIIFVILLFFLTFWKCTVFSPKLRKIMLKIIMILKLMTSKKSIYIYYNNNNKNICSETALTGETRFHCEFSYPRCESLTP